MSLKIPYGLKQGRLWLAAEVANGNKCGCVCPKCKTPLQARNNPKNKKVPHFAHYRSVECSHNGMTDIHRYAQQVLVDHKRFTIPQFSEVPKVKLIDGSTHFGEEVHIGSRLLVAEVVEEEYRWQGLVPDICFHSDEGLYFLEIFVTHAVDEKKKLQIQKSDLPMIEIDLSDIDESIIYSKEAFTAVVLNPKDRATWVNYPLANQLLIRQKKELHQEAKIKNEKIRRKKDQDRKNERSRQLVIRDKITRKQKLIENQRKNIASELTLLHKSKKAQWLRIRQDHLEGTVPKEKCIRERLEYLRRENLVGTEHPNDWIINAHRIVWQSNILDILPANPKYEQSIRINDIERAIVKTFGIPEFMGKLNIEAQRIKQRRNNRGSQSYSHLTPDEISSIISPYRIIKHYLMHLKKMGYVQINEESILPLYDSPEEYHRERLKRPLPPASNPDIETRIELLIRADKRLMSRGNGNGYKCSQCEMALLESDNLCPFCGSEERSKYSVDDYLMKNAVNRYKCSVRPRNSLSRHPDIRCEVLEAESNRKNRGK